MRIGVVAPSTPITPAIAERAIILARRQFPEAKLHFHPQCFIAHKHFAGDDRTRAEAFLEVANDPSFDALWFARGGYGSCRIAEEVLGRLEPQARDKIYLGYSDAGYMLAGLYAAGFTKVAHGPMPGDLRREAGEEAIARALAWMIGGSPEAVEPNALRERSLAFNITVFSQLIGTPLQPDVSGHVLMLEDVSEQLYRTDRSLFHITSNPSVRKAAGIRMGRCTEVPENDPDFGETEEEIVRFWCERSQIPYLGRCDIGHDAANKVVPFGLSTIS